MAYSQIIDNSNDFKQMLNECEDFRDKIIFNGTENDTYNGFAPKSWIKLKNVLLFYIDKCEKIYKTKMNLLLFYTDFYAYKTINKAITGLSYIPTEYGPAPSSYNSLYSCIEDVDTIMEIGGNIDRTQLFSNKKPDLEVFNDNEISVLNHIHTTFGSLSGYKIIAIFHEENLWNNINSNEKMIDFKYAFSLKSI